MFESPFHHTGAVEMNDPTLVPRPDLTKYIWKRLVKGDFAAVVSERATGKTTLARLIDANKPSNFQTSYLDCGRYVACEPGEFFSYFTQSLYEGLGAQKVNAENPRERKVSSGVGFGSYVIYLNESIKEHPKQKRRLVILDDVDAMPPEVLESLLANIRAFHQSTSPKNRRILFYLTGMIDLLSASGGKSSPFNIVSKVGIPYFTLEEVKQLVAGARAAPGFDFGMDDEVICYLHEQTSGHPGLFQTMAHYAFQCAHNDPERGNTVTKKHGEEGVDAAVAVGALMLRRMQGDLIALLGKRYPVGKPPRDILLDMIENRKVSFEATFPGISDLRLIGVIEKDAATLCVFRSPVTKRIALQVLPAREDSV